MYIGQRNYLNQVNRAAEEIGAEATPEQQAAAAEKYGVRSEDVANRVGMMNEPKENYISGAPGYYAVTINGKTYHSPDKAYLERKIAEGTTTQQEFMGALFTKQGYNVTASKEGLTISKPGYTTVTQEPTYTDLAAAKQFYLTGTLPVYDQVLVTFKDQPQKSSDYNPTPGGKIGARDQPMSIVVKQPSKFSMTVEKVRHSYAYQIIGKEEIEGGFIPMLQDIKKNPVPNLILYGAQGLLYVASPPLGAITTGGLLTLRYAKSDTDFITTTRRIMGETAPFIIGGIAVNKLIKIARNKTPSDAIIEKTQRQKLATYESAQGQQTIVQSEFTVNVGKKSYNVAGQGVESAVNVGGTKQVLIGAYEFKSGKYSATQVSQGFRTIGETGSMTYLEFQNFIYKGRTMPGKVTYSFGEIINKEQLFMKDQYGLNTYTTSSIIGSSKQVTITPDTYAANYKSISSKPTKLTSIEAGRVAEILKVDKITFAAAVLKEAGGKKYVKTFSNLINEKATVENIPIETTNQYANLKGSMTTIKTSPKVSPQVSLEIGAKSTAVAIYNQEAPQLKQIALVSRTAAATKTISLTGQQPVVKAITKTNNKTSFISESQRKTKQEQQEKSLFKTAQKPALDIKNLSNQRTESISSSALDQIQISKQDQEQRQETNQRTNQIMDMGARSISITTPTPPQPLNLATLKGTGEAPRSNNLFQALVKRRGKFSVIGSYSTAKEAFLKGRERVRTTAAASFKVQSPGGQAQTERILSPDITMSKRLAGVFVQRREFRISTPGEKKEITFKGILKNRLKKFSWG